MYEEKLGADSYTRLEEVERRMEKIGEDDVADRASELAKKVKQFHRDVDARMEEEAERAGITQ